jgi:RNA recognition motif-containing protein
MMPVHRTSPQALEEAFSRYGTVRSARVARKRDDGSSMGFGFVELESGAAAAAAMAELEGSNLHGRMLRIRWAALSCLTAHSKYFS